MNSRICARVLLLGVVAQPVSAQLSQPNDAGVAMGHLHYYVRDVEANQRFWESLGGEATSFGQSVVMKFPDVLVFLSQGEPEGGTEGSILNHVAFRVQSLDTVAAAGFEFDPPPSGVTNVYSPEGERIELFDDTATNLTFTLDTDDDGSADPVAARHNRPLDVPIVAHHLHLCLVDDAVEEAQDWYATMFGGQPSTRWRYDAVDLPGINLNFSYNSDAGGAPTVGRMLDHIGFEVTNLEAFCGQLDAKGVTFDVPYTLHTSGIGYAFLRPTLGASASSSPRGCEACDVTLPRAANMAYRVSCHFDEQAKYRRAVVGTDRAGRREGRVPALDSLNEACRDN